MMFGKMRLSASLAIVACCFLMAGSGLAQGPTSVDQLIVTTEDYPPFNFSSEDELQGISTDIMSELFIRTQSKLTKKDIQLLPWTRAYKLALNRPNFAVYSTTRTESREDLFKWVGPFVPTVIAVVAKKEKAFEINTNEDLHKLRIGVVRDDIGQLLLKETGMPDERIEPVLRNDQNYRKLFSDRIDAIAYESNVVNWQIKAMGEAPEAFEVIYELQRAELYLALNPSVSDKLVSLLQEKLDEMKADGTHEAILSKYLSP